MQRLFLPLINNENTVVITNSSPIYNQLTKVLRCKVSDEIIFFDGKKNLDLIYKIESITKQSIAFKLQKIVEKLDNSKITINLYQSIPNKQEKIEYILQKGVEVGYNNFYFFKSERSQNLKISENKIERFKKIITEAVEQSGRNIIPELYFLEKIDYKNIKGKNIYSHTDKTNAKKLKDLNIKDGKNNIFVGPEGGFSDREIEIFEKNNLTKINLGDYILRTETAGIVIGFYLIQNI